MQSTRLFSRKVNPSKISLIKLVSNGLDSSLFKLNHPEFIKLIQESIPESALLKGKATVSAEGNPQSKSLKTLYGFTMADEEIRAFSGLLRFKDVISGSDTDYDSFVACQIEMKKPVLTRESFNKIGQYVREKLKSPESCASAIWSILCNDLGKVHEVIAEYEKKSNKRNVGHDLLLAEILELKSNLFPGFLKIPAEYRKQIISGYASGCDVSQFEQLELPVVALKNLQTLNKESLDLYILHSIFDVSGAAAHFKSNGSLTMHEETWQFFNATRESLETLSNRRNSIESAYNSYLNYRGKCINISNNSDESVALIRIASLARLATPLQGRILLDVWEKIPNENKKILIDELIIHGDKGLRAIFIGYGVAMLLNPQGALQGELTAKAKLDNKVVTSEQRAEATKEGLAIGLINMSRAFSLARNTISNDSTNEIFVAECDLIVRALNKDPNKSLDMKFSIDALCDRRMDLSFKLPKLKQECEQIPINDVLQNTKKILPKTTGQSEINSSWRKVATVSSVFLGAATLFAVCKYFVGTSADGSTPRPRSSL
jgi:hypothetical protein